MAPKKKDKAGEKYKAKGGLPKELANHAQVDTWKAGLTALRSTDVDADLTEMYGYFKKVAGKDKKLTRKEFLTGFTSKVQINGEQISVADAETLFNASAIDYDYNTVSLHECAGPCAALPAAPPLTGTRTPAGS